MSNSTFSITKDSLRKRRRSNVNDAKGHTIDHTVLSKEHRKESGIVVAALTHQHSLLSMPTDLFCALARFTHYRDFLCLMCARREWYRDLWHGSLLESTGDCTGYDDHTNALGANGHINTHTKTLLYRCLPEMQFTNTVKILYYHPEAYASLLPYRTWHSIVSQTPIHLAHLHVTHGVCSTSIHCRPMYTQLLRRCGPTLETLRWTEDMGQSITRLQFRYIHQHVKFQVLHTLRVHVWQHESGLMWTLLLWMPATLRHFDYRYRQEMDSRFQDQGYADSILAMGPQLMQRIQRLSWLGMDTPWGLNDALVLRSILTGIPAIRQHLTRLCLKTSNFIRASGLHALTQVQHQVFGMHDALGGSDPHGLCGPCSGPYDVSNSPWLPNLRHLDLYLYTEEHRGPEFDSIFVLFLNMMARRQDSMPQLISLCLVMNANGDVDDLERSEVVSHAFAHFWSSLALGDEQLGEDQSSMITKKPCLKRLVLKLPYVVFTPECRNVRLEYLDVYRCFHVFGTQYWPIYSDRIRLNTYYSPEATFDLLQLLNGSPNIKACNGSPGSLGPLCKSLIYNISYDYKTDKWCHSEGLAWIEDLTVIHFIDIGASQIYALCRAKWLNRLVRLKTFRLLMTQTRWIQTGLASKRIRQMFASHLGEHVYIDIQLVAENSDIERVCRGEQDL